MRVYAYFYATYSYYVHIDPTNNRGAEAKREGVKVVKKIKKARVGYQIKENFNKNHNALFILYNFKIFECQVQKVFFFTKSQKFIWP